MRCDVGLYSASVFLLILCSTTSAKRVLSHRGTGRCGLGRFSCNSGQCIGEDLLCDGKADCGDNSDETQEVCSDIHCPSFIFRCNYGACVNARAKCNGVRDCLDGSDEASCWTLPTTTAFTPFTTRRRPAGSKPLQPINCLIPNDPENGIYTIGGRPPDADRTGDSVEPFSVLVTNCDTGYETSPSNTKYSVCANGIWTPLPSTCSSFPQASDPVNPMRCQCFC